jgi:phage gpG-like protein
MIIEADKAPEQLGAWASQLMVGDFTEFLQDAAMAARQDVRDNFTSSATPENLDWPERKIIGDGHPLLIDTGLLLQAATGGGVGHIEQISDNSLTFGVDGGVVPYAGVHNYGSVKKNIPQREFLGLTEETIDALEESLANFVIGNFL